MPTGTRLYLSILLAASLLQGYSREKDIVEKNKDRLIIKGKKIKTMTWISYSFNEKGKQISKEKGVYHFDSCGNFIKYPSSEGYATTEFTFDKKGRNFEQIIYNSKNELESKITFTYDSLSRVTEQFECTHLGRPFEKHIYSYDIKGDLVSDEKYCGKELTIDGRSVYTYDSAHHKIQEINYFKSASTIFNKISYQ
ncbi:MAG TPA: hypothetical protein VNX68_00535, partial [Nitrosopumilaceae archaeon]|nr:hypothetical protein [Nitrosopumilaceae archaeon]